MRNRTISRLAFLQEYTGHPENLLPLLDEVAEKGYAGICIQADYDCIYELCARAAALGLWVSAFTFYMKYEEKYLAEHPDQRIVSASEWLDQDGRTTSSWGCPFNSNSKQRYLDFLRKVAAYPGIREIMLNDEACLPVSGCHCQTCRQEYREAFGSEMPIIPSPKPEDWNDETWRRFIKWNIDRWNSVHGEMAAVIHAVDPAIKAVFQASPYSDLWRNPWSHSVDLSSMVEQIDGLYTDPYYTFHNAPFFTPKETYLSEWSRFLRGIAGDGKIAGIIPQGFSWPAFNRPLGREDGYWSAIIPPACGIDNIAPYTYTLQGCSPVQETYESCLAMDEYFEQASPLKYAGIVHGVHTEMYTKPLPLETPNSYDGTRVLPIARCMREKGIPYGYIPDSKLSDQSLLSEYKVIILPEICCLSKSDEESLTQYVEEGRKLVILGQLGNADEIGTKLERSLLQRLFGVTVESEEINERQFKLLRDYPELGRLQPDDNGKYLGGVRGPLYTLKHCIDAKLPDTAEIIAEFIDDNGIPNGQPAIAGLGRNKNVLWFAGMPDMYSLNSRYHLAVRNMAQFLFGHMVEELVGQRPELHVDGWPAEVPMRVLCPFDPMYMSTYEFFPLMGDDFALGIVTSYFKEPSSFPMVLDIPIGKNLRKVTELISGKDVEHTIRDNVASINVEVGFDTPALVYAFFYK